MVKRLIFLAGHLATGTELTQLNFGLISELSKFGDVHCWFDNDHISHDSLEQIETYAKAFYVQKHDEYDFGSWKRLYHTIGYEAVELYDELVLVNDSSLVIGDMKPLFDHREQSDAEFFSSIMIDEGYFGPPISNSDYKDSYDSLKRSAMYVSSFWSLRQNLVRSSLFSCFIKSIGPLNNRLSVSHKYERGFSRSLWRNNVTTDTFIRKVFRGVPVYSEDAFQLIKLGLPLVKSKLLTESYYQIPDLEFRLESLMKNIDPMYAKNLELAIKIYTKFGKINAK